MGIPFESSFVNEVLNGLQTRFWKDIWCSNSSKLMELFPRLYAFENQKDCMVSDRWKLVDGSWSGSWDCRTRPRGRISTKFESIQVMIGNLRLCADSSNRWVWSLHPSGSFLVKNLSVLIQNKLLNAPLEECKFKWNSLVLIKVNICLWRMFLDHLPVCVNLSKKGIEVNSLVCLFCANEMEDQEDCLFSCPKVKPIWLRL